jgi:hypothetical protein
MAIGSISSDMRTLKNSDFDKKSMKDGANSTWVQGRDTQ